MARAGAADLFRAVSDAADPDAGEGRPVQGPSRRRRRRVAAVGARDVAALPRAPPGSRAARHRRSRLHLDLPGRYPLADLCRTLRLRQHVRRCRAGPRLGRYGRDHPAGQRVQRRGAGPLRRAGKAVCPRDRNDAGPQSPDLGLRDRPRHQRRPSAAAKNLARGRGCARPLLARHRPARHRCRPAAQRPAPPERRRDDRRNVQAGADARARAGACRLVRASRHQPRDHRDLRGGADLAQRLRAGPPDGRRRAIAGADHHACKRSWRQSPCRSRSRSRWWPSSPATSSAPPPSNCSARAARS
ncbi:hypothetical protein ACVWZZ_000226 [Bradyrhizobium sp. LM6.10]